MRGSVASISANCKYKLQFAVVRKEDLAARLIAHDAPDDFGVVATVRS
jgi:hypothetical protein